VARDAHRSILFVTEMAPARQALSGFAPRVHHFLRSVARDVEVHLAVVRFGAQTVDLTGAAELPLASVTTLEVPARLDTRSLRSRARKAARYVVPTEPSGVYPLRGSLLQAT
jgi:hypothetical protein